MGTARQASKEAYGQEYDHDLKPTGGGEANGGHQKENGEDLQYADEAVRNDRNVILALSQ
jgi:hypothetical protein